MKFLTAFIPAFLATGVALGTAYVLVMKALRADRTKVEEWLDKLRKRLQSGPVPIIEIAQPVMLGALQAIYGRTAGRRFGASFLIGVIFTSITFGVVYWQYRHIPPTLRATKAELERDADPVLYKYVTDPALRPEYDRIDKTEAVSTDLPSPSQDYVYNVGIHRELRERRFLFPTRLAAKLFSDPARIDLTFLLIVDGTYINPHFQFRDFSFLFAFNVLLDFLSATMAVASLRLLGRKLVLGRAALAFGCTLCGTSMCAAIAFLSYVLFFCGDIGVFWRELLLVPLVLVGGVVGTVRFISRFKRNKSYRETLWWAGLTAPLGLALGILGLKIFVWPLWPTLPSGAVSWHDVLSIPYVLAATTLVPATLNVAAFALVLVAKLTAEPARVIPEAYMTFVKEELGGTQAAGLMIVLSAAIAAIFGLIWRAT